MAHRIGFVGAGKMAQALARGWLGAGIASSKTLFASDVDPAARAVMERELGLGWCPSNRELAQSADVIVLAVKPQVLDDVLADFSPVLGNGHLLVSIAAGVDLARLESLAGAGRRIIRVMPNNPCLVGEAASAFAANSHATEDDVRFVRTLLDSVGRSEQVSEKLLDAVTGLSGSGPAYVYQVIEALSDAGVKQGLTREVALRLAAQTVLGAAKMVLETGRHPSELKDMVTSPGGTTIAGLAVLERRGLRSALIDAVEAATLRSIELGRS